MKRAAMHLTILTFYYEDALPFGFMMNIMLMLMMLITIPGLVYGLIYKI